jgi:hypothetical protein
MRRLLNFAKNLFSKYDKMKSTLLLSVAALSVQQVASHATFQELWVNGVDEICTLFPIPTRRL